MSVPRARVESRLLLVLVILGVMFVGALGSAPPVSASATAGVCDRAVALVKEGALEDAEALAAAVGGECPAGVRALTTQARAASDALVEQSIRESDAAEQRRLAQLAVDLDANNGEAKELLVEPAAEQDLGLCAEADAAVKNGQFARAEALYGALEGAKEAESCRQAGLVDLADAHSSAWPQRISDAVTEDGLLLLLFAAIAFGVGVAITMWRRPRGVPFGRAGVLALTLLTFFGLVAWHLWSRSDTLALVLLGLVLLLALLTGVAASTLSRSRAPLRIEVGSAAEDKQGEAVARRAVTQLHDLADGQSSGVYALTGTDLHDTGIRGIFGAFDYPWLGTLLKVWDAVALRSGDRVVLTTDGDETGVAMYEGSRLAHVRSVDATHFRVDPAKATKSERASVVRDVATEVAAHLLWWRLPDPAAEPRLYGASKASGLALATIAAQRLADEDLAGAGALAARAEHSDPGNRAAVLTRASADLFGTPAAAVEDLRLRQLEELLREEEERAPGGDSPLAWRVRYTLAVGLVNREVSRRPGLNGEAWREPFLKALRLWASFLPPTEWDGLPLDPPDAAVETKVSITPRAGQQALWRYLVEASHSAAISVAVALRSQPGEPVDTAQLDAWPLVGSRSDHRNLACGYATAYRLISAGNPDLRRRLANRCVQRIRLAAPEPRQREGVLDDPFLGWVKDSDPYRGLLADWGLADGPYAWIESFGKHAAALARSHPVPADLLVALDSSAGRQSFRSEYRVDAQVLNAWRGAAQWLDAGVDGSLVDRYQRAGFTDRDHVRNTQDTVVAERLVASASVSGTDVPSANDRATMRG